MKKVLKPVFSLMRFIARKLGYKLLITGNHDGDLFEYNVVDGFWPDGRIMKQYEQSIRHVDGKSSDNLNKKMRYQVMTQLLEKAVHDNPDLDAAECGCWNGHSTHMCATLMRQQGFSGEFHVFDSFEGGLSAFTARDKGSLAPTTDEDEEKVRAYFESSEDAVRKRLSDFDFVHLYKGWIPERFDEVVDRQFGFVNIDVDMYDPILDSLKFFYPRLADGGIVYLDDYNAAGFPGAKRAIDDFMKDTPPTFFISMPFGSAFIIK